ncbi:hypothetical protein GGI09_001802 [Coemansia sp. S100]|nr:hypothetical protein H4S03_006994 [Coemansia sp. S3946]KAJ2101342.1 hypothetical protein GGI09_001802 [Coemansia sp. S100]
MSTYYNDNTGAEELRGFLDTAVALAKEVGPAFKEGFWRKGQFASADDFAAEGKQGNIADCVVDFISTPW